MIVKAEVTCGELNPRYVVTSEPAQTPALVYQFYGGRGDSENRIKEMKLDLDSGRTSCHRFLANQCRLLLHAAACVLLGVLQEAAACTSYAGAQISTLRLRVLKAGAWVVESCRKVWVHVASAFPEQTVWRHLHHRLANVQIGTAFSHE